MNSKFFATGDSSSDSDDHSASSSDEEQVVVTAAPVRPSRFARDSDSDDEDVKRVVKSTKDKRLDAMVSTVGQMRNHVKIHDWNSLSTDYDILNKHRERVAATTAAGTAVPGVISSLKASTSGAPEPTPAAPDVYIRALVMLEDALESDLAAKGDLKLSKTNTKALNAMKQRLRKNNKQYADAMAAFRATGKDPMESDSEDESSESSSSSSSSSSSDDEPVVKKAPVRNRFLKGSDSDGSSSSSDSDSDSDSDSSSDSDVSDKGPKAGGGGGSRWLLKGQEKADKPSAAAKPRERIIRAKAALESEEEDDEEVQPGPDDVEAGFQVVGRGGAKASAPFIPAADMTEAVVNARLRETLAARGRRGTNRAEQIATIEFLVTAAKTPRQRAQVLLHLISAQFDFAPAKSAYMPSKLWRSTLDNVAALFALATAHHPSLSFTDQGDDTDMLVVASAENAALMGASVPDPTGEDGKEPETPADTPVRGDLATLVERLDDELYKALQNIDAYSSLYVARLRDEAPWMELSAIAQTYFEETLGDLPRAARVATRRILHLYYKRDQLVATVQDLYKKAEAAEAGAPVVPDTPAADAVSPESEPDAITAGKGLEAPVGGPETASGQVRTLAVLVYRYGDERAKSQTMLAQIYNHAVGNRFYAGRDLLLVSHLQDTVILLDVGLQVLFNRAMTQLGLCAFRLGLPFESHACLQDMCSPSATGGGGPARLKELLAQGVVTMRGVEKTPEEEKAELRRQVPYHMHLSLDFIETAHLVSAMLLEVPAMALHRVRGDGGRRRAVSKSFQYFLRNSMKSAFPGPPENTRDHVMAATRCLMKGDWRGAYGYVSAIRAWTSLETAERSTTLKRLRELLKTAGLRTFVLAYSTYYESMSAEWLSGLFELPAARVHSVVSKMIVHGDISAAWHQPTSSVVMRKVEPSRLQSLALGLASKVSSVIDLNERLLDAKAGGSSGGRDDDWQGGGNRGGFGGRGGRGGYPPRGGGRGGYGGRGASVAAGLSKGSYARG